MNTIPTAEEFLKNCQLEGNWTAKRMLIEFAKLHVQAALKAALNKATIAYKEEEFQIEDQIQLFEINKNSILEAYPLTKIK